MKLKALLLLLCSACTLWGQAPEPAASPAPLPSGPLLARAPDFAAWQVTITEPPSPFLVDKAPAGASSASAGAAPKSKARRTVVRVTKTGGILHEETVDADGNRVSRWCVGTVQYVEKPGSPQPLRVSGGGLGSDFVNYSGSDFPDCAWVGPKNFTGLRKVAGHDCLVFGDQVDASLPTGTDPKAGKLDNGQSYLVQSAAYIDVESRLPVVARRGDTTLQYEILAAPQTMQTLPANLETAEKMEKQRQQDLMRKPAGA